MKMSLQSDNKSTIQVRIDSGWHKRLKIIAAQRGTSIKGLLDEIFSEAFGSEVMDEGEINKTT